MRRFVTCNRDQPFLLPPDLRDWIPQDDLAHFVIEAVDRVDMSHFSVNERGTGSEQYHPQMMLALLIYCYANGIFSSRRIERATWRDIGVRFVAADTHPDHDTICAFRRNNFEAIHATFVEVLRLARELKLLKLGTVSIDGTKVDANANRHKGVRYDRAGELIDQLDADVKDLLDKAESADQADLPDPQSLPEDLSRRQTLRAKLDDARKRLQSKAKARAEAEQADYEAKVKAREEREGKRQGKRPKPPESEPAPDEQTNLTDPDSALMRKSKRHEYRQAYNGQLAVDADGSQLIVGVGLTNCASDANELVSTVKAIPKLLGRPSTVLADSGYANGDEVDKLHHSGIDVLVATGAEDRHRRYDFRPPKHKAPVEPKAEWKRAMKAKTESDEGRRLYRLRKQTVEPAIGIIKHAMGFRQFLLRGLPKVTGEWELVALAYNFKRIHRMRAA